MTPTARSLRLLRERGCVCEVVEHFNRFARRRLDFLGIIDILALEPGTKGVLGIQATTVANQSARIKKILDEPRALAWLGAGQRLEIWGWAKKGKQGRRKTWELSVTPITEANWRQAAEGLTYLPSRPQP